MDKDRVEGAARNTGGKMKEAAGRGQNVVGGIKDVLRDSNKEDKRGVDRRRT